MTPRRNLHQQSNYSGLLIASVLLGAGIALLIISFFVFGVDNSKPEWGEFWRIKPLIITPLSGAIGGAFYSFMLHQSSKGFNRIIAVILGIVGFIIALWMGVVLGLNGTMWD